MVCFNQITEQTTHLLPTKLKKKTFLADSKIQYTVSPCLQISYPVFPCPVNYCFKGIALHGSARQDKLGEERLGQARQDQCIGQQGYFCVLYFESATK